MEAVRPKSSETHPSAVIASGLEVLPWHRESCGSRLPRSASEDAGVFIVMVARTTMAWMQRGKMADSDVDQQGRKHHNTNRRGSQTSCNGNSSYPANGRDRMGPGTDQPVQPFSPTNSLDPKILGSHQQTSISGTTRSYHIN
jgi:hypothetical protein